MDQIPSIAEGPSAGGGAGGGGGGGGGGGEAPAPPALPEYAPALYPAYGYGSPAYGGGGGSPAAQAPAPPTTMPSLYAYGSPAYANNGYVRVRSHTRPSETAAVKAAKCEAENELAGG